MATKKRAVKKTSRKPLAKAIAVLVTTEFRGVFCGITKDPDAEPIQLTDARNCIYWSSDVGGFLGLAERGPNGSCRIGAPAPGKTVLRKVTCVSELSELAAAAWRNAPVYRG